nr:conserved hypothetical protein [Bosea sp. 7B]
MPVEASVATILRPTWPDLPMPVTITRPEAARIISTAAMKGSARPLPIASCKASSPARSVAMVRRAEALMVAVMERASSTAQARLATGAGTLTRH